MKEVVFVEGVNGAGKDYFLDKLNTYFPHNEIFYAPKDNHLHAGVTEAAFITYNTIFRSIEKDTSRNTAFIYRSPITEFVSNKFYNREVPSGLENDLLGLMKGFMASKRCTILYLNPPEKILHERRPKLSIDDILKLKAYYVAFLANNFRDFVVTYDSWDAFIGEIDKQIETLPCGRVLFMDYDDTLLQYKDNYRRDFPNGKCEVTGIFSPPEKDLPIIFISGREQNIHCLTSPYVNMFKSSYNYKYAFFRKLLERNKFFVWYDDYITIQAQLADEFSNTRFTITNNRINKIGRLENG
jgi:hypothetical protein